MRALVTGATSGLGKEIAVQLGQRGWRVALTGRREAKLKEAADAVKAAGGAPLALLGSVTDPAVVKDQYRRIREEWGGLDWAILNSGVGETQDAREFTAANVVWTFETNVFGVAYWLEAVLPDMIKGGSGTVAAVSSIAGFRGLPKTGAYSSSKAAVNTLLESTRVDLRGTGVRVVTVCPGFVKSEMTDRNDPKHMPFRLETADGAARIIAGVEAGRRIVHFPWQLSAPVIYGLHNLPGWLYDRLAGLIPRRKKPYVDESKK